MGKPRFSSLSLTEAAIYQYGEVALAQWVLLKHRTRSSGGAVYRSFTDQRQGKFGWGRSKFFGVMSGLVEKGLAKRYPWGWALATTSKVIGTHKGNEIRHKCTLLLPKRCDERYIRDLLRLKLMEMGHRQNERYGTKLHPEQLLAIGRINAKTCGKLIRQLPHKTAQSPNTALLGSTPDQLLKCAQRGYVAMNTHRLMKTTGLGRTALFSWKKRARRRGWFTQKNRSFEVPVELEPGLPVMHEHWQATCGGKFSWGSRPKFHQASMYKMNLDY